jgi:hypothetical protein
MQRPVTPLILSVFLFTGVVLLESESCSIIKMNETSLAQGFPNALLKLGRLVSSITRAGRRERFHLNLATGPTGTVVRQKENARAITASRD